METRVELRLVVIKEEEGRHSVRVTFFPRLHVPVGDEPETGVSTWVAPDGVKNLLLRALNTLFDQHTMLALMHPDYMSTAAKEDLANLTVLQTITRI